MATTTSSAITLRGSTDIVTDFFGDYYVFIRPVRDFTWQFGIPTLPILEESVTSLPWQRGYFGVRSV